MTILPVSRVGQNIQQCLSLGSVTCCGHDPLMDSFDLSPLPDSDCVYPCVIEHITQSNSFPLFGFGILPIQDTQSVHHIGPSQPLLNRPFPYSVHSPAYHISLS